ncbi:MAG TPA: sugar phosphate isomerase/epimerase, partial [Dehalococcoidia bacterium]|nr:sugar phosphate isomerase/epimerase [Dehalococcoidia bacterium]
MWAQQERFADLARFHDAAARFGYDAIEVSHSTSEEGLRALLAAGKPSVASLHAPTPYRRLDDGRHNGDANLASTDEQQRQIAIAEHLRTIDCAADAGLRYVVVHLGGVGDRRSDLEEHLRGLYESGVREGPAWTAAQDALREWRGAARTAYYAAAKRSLEALVEYAAPRDVALGLESRLNYHEFPHPDEALDLLAPYDNSIAGFWYDTGHCEVQARLGMIDRDLWFPALTPRMLGAHLHDVDGILDHRAPGNGTLDWAYVAAAIPPDSLRVLEINQHEPDALVAAAPAFLRARGIVSR